MSKLDFPGEQSPDRSSERNIDPRTREFMDVVDCSAGEVKDIPLGRAVTIEEHAADCSAIDPEARRRSLAETPVYFGRFKGQKLNNVPLWYLSWALTRQSKNRSFRKFQKLVREFLETPSGPKQKAKQATPDFDSPANSGNRGRGTSAETT